MWQQVTPGRVEKQLLLDHTRLPAKHNWSLPLATGILATCLNLDLSTFLMNAEGTRAGVFTGAVSAKQLLTGVMGSATGTNLQPLARSALTGHLIRSIVFYMWVFFRLQVSSSPLALKYRKVLHVAVCVCLLSWPGDVRYHESSIGVLPPCSPSTPPPKKYAFAVCGVSYEKRKITTADHYHRTPPRASVSLFVDGLRPLANCHRPPAKDETIMFVLPSIRI